MEEVEGEVVADLSVKRSLNSFARFEHLMCKSASDCTIPGRMCSWNFPVDSRIIFQDTLDLFFDASTLLLL